MPDAVCRRLTLLCTLVVACPIGTHLGLLHLLWMLASGRLRGARPCAAAEVVVLDAGCGVALLHEEGTPRSVVRLATKATVRRAVPPPYSGRGRPPTRGATVRPLARTPFPQDVPLPAHLRDKASATAHLPKGFWGQRRTPATPATPTTLAAAT